jgi:hypothetical protein
MMPLLCAFRSRTLICVSHGVRSSKRKILRQCVHTWPQQGQKLGRPSKKAWSKSIWAPKKASLAIFPTCQGLSATFGPIYFCNILQHLPREAHADHAHHLFLSPHGWVYIEFGWYTRVSLLLTPAYHHRCCQCHLSLLEIQFPLCKNAPSAMLSNKQKLFFFS